MQLRGPIKYHNQALAVSTNYSLDIPRNRFIQRLILRLRVVGTNSIQSGPADDKIAAFISSLKLTVDGKDTRVSGSLAELHYFSTYTQGVLLQNNLVTTDGSSIEVGVCEAVVHFGLNPKNPFDTSGLLPAHMFTSLVLEFSTTAAAVIASGGFTFVSATLEVSGIEADLSAAEIKAQGKFWAYYLTSKVKTIDAVYTMAAPQEISLPVGKIVRRIGVFTRLNSVRSDAQISEYAIRDKRRDIDMLRSLWGTSRTQDRYELGLRYGDQVTGYTIVDLTRLGSLNLKGYAPDQVTFQQATTGTTATSDTKLLTEEVF